MQRRGKHFCFPLCFFLLVLFFFVFSLLVLLPSGCCFCMLFLLFLFVFCFFSFAVLLIFSCLFVFYVFSFSLFCVFFCFCFIVLYAFSFLLFFPFSFSHFSLSFYSPCFFFLFILYLFSAFFTLSFGFARPFRRFLPIVSAVLFCNEVFASVDRFDFDFPAIKLRQTAVCVADFHVVTHLNPGFGCHRFQLQKMVAAVSRQTDVDFYFYGIKKSTFRERCFQAILL